MEISVSFELYKNLHKLPEVTDPRIVVNSKSMLFSNDGLYSEEIFGPLKNYKCRCGKTYSKENDNIRCPSCNVICGPITIRNDTFGKIVLPENIYYVLPTMKQILFKYFGEIAVKNILNKNLLYKNIDEPYYLSLKDYTLKRKSKMKKQEKILEEFSVNSPKGLFKLWEHVMFDNDLRTLIMDPVLKDRVKQEFVFLNEVVVTPPDSRPLIMTPDGKLNVNPIAVHYVEILKNITGSFSDSLYNDDECDSNDATLRAHLDTWFKYQDSVDELFDKIITPNFRNKTGTMRNSITGKTVESSGRAVIVPDPTIEQYTISLPVDMVTKIFQLDILRFKFLQSTNGLNDHISTMYSAVGSDGIVRLASEEFEMFTKTLDAKVLLERPPTLYKYNAGGYKVCHFFDQDNQVIEEKLNIQIIGRCSRQYSIRNNYKKKDHNGNNIE